MAKEIVWTLRAQRDRKELLRYWLNNNDSSEYSIKLNYLFEEAAHLIGRHPQIGGKTDVDDNVRVKIVRDYLMFYEIRSEKNIYPNYLG